MSRPAEKPDIYAKFYGNEDTCDLLAKSKYEAYRVFASGHAELLTFGQHADKFDAYYDRSLKTLSKSQIISNKKELFTKEVIDQLVKDAIYVWEREGDELIESPATLTTVIFHTCLNRKAN